MHDKVINPGGGVILTTVFLSCICISGPVDAQKAAGAKTTDTKVTAAKRNRLTKTDRIIAEAEKYLGQPYVFGGRDARMGCVKKGRRVKCLPGIDCQSLIFFAYEKVFRTSWKRYSVMPSTCVRRNQLGKPVKGMSAVLRENLEHEKLEKGDVLFFLLEDYNLENDKPLWVHEGRKFGVWHTGLVHGVVDGVANAIHAKPGDKVLIEGLMQVEFEALFVVRLSKSKNRPKAR